MPEDALTHRPHRDAAGPVVPLLPSRALLHAPGGLAGVGAQAGVDGVADPALEAPERLFVRLSLG